MSVKVDLPTDAELARMFDAVPALEKHRVGDQVTRAGANVVLAKAKQLAPRGNARDRALRSASQKAEHKWDAMPLWKTLKVKVVKYRDGAASAVVGPRWPEGNKAYFGAFKKGWREMWFWGHASYRRMIAFDWLRHAAESTRGQQVQAQKQKLKALLDDIWRSAGRG